MRRTSRREKDAAAEALRARALTLFASPADGAAGTPQSTGDPDVRRRGDPSVLPAPSAEPSADDPAGAAGAAGLRRMRGRLWWTIRERLPVWVQLRCGVQPRTLLALSVVLVACLAFAVHRFWSGTPRTVRAPTAEPAATQEARHGPGTPGRPGPGSVPSGTAAPIVIDVTGRVRDPGIHRLTAGARVADALREAGGVRPGTDTSGLNRARLLVDGEQIVVGGPASSDGGVPGPAGARAPAGGPAPVSLNSATVEQLDTLPGVGPVLAQHILDYRTEHGGFRSVDQLREVSGIGDRRFADLRPLVRP
ncbi:helix-hairpin-helix domain-containing protein [Streptomyces meridianus]|uniref:ComEA family DNA-binding protein n=1 Tax=Streptomyces meridianus TaxID=2938945 RepID=A0ABT0X1M0_9ACTN|nr:ComEA family DNA-binding protein [Streptomyces meridianus]MCM2576050.1 ComEA family DNA-binding protein [Streptomyces meridianus]